MTISPTQLRSAIGHLDLTISALSKELGVASSQISDFTNEKAGLSKKNLDKIETYMENRGLEFLPDDGLRKKRAHVETYEGNDGFRTFYDDVYETIKKEGGNLCLYNGIAQQFIDALGQKYIDAHQERMLKIQARVNFRIIVEHGDRGGFGAEYAHYRWFPSEHFNNGGVFIYGAKVAFIDFADRVKVIVIKDIKIAESQKLNFELLWKYVAEEIPE